MSFLFYTMYCSIEDTTSVFSLTLQDMHYGCLFRTIIASDIQNFLTSRTIKASYKQTVIRLWRRQLKLMAQSQFKRGHLLAEIDLSRIKSSVYRTEWN